MSLPCHKAFENKGLAMFCTQCGATITAETKFCPRCGAQSETSSGPAPQPARQLPPDGLTVPSPITFAGTNPPGNPQPVYTGEPRTDGKAIGSLILGIVSIVLFIIPVVFAIPAVILGHISRSSIKKSMGRLQGDGMALAGLIMGYINIALLPFLLIIAAIAIPNFIRARMSANESAAANVMRTLVTNNVAYSMNYPERGYASDLAALGPGPDGTCAGEGTADHACLIDNLLGNSRCTAGAWCAKGAYKFTLVSAGGDPATDFVIAATPVSDESGMKSYCATADGVIRRKTGEISAPPTVRECLAWEML